MAAEKQFENKIKSFLKDKGIYHFKFWAGPYSKVGIPDIIACVNGRFVGIEVKGPNGRASEIQKYNIKKINESGGLAYILYPKDFDSFKNDMEEILNENSC